MSKKKVTLSIDDKTYDDFKKFCDRNAIMLSKKIELYMKDILKRKKQALLFLIPLILLTLMGSLASAAIIFEDGFEDGNISDWTITPGATSEWIVTNTEGPLGNYHVISRGSDSETIIERTISTQNYENITFNFYWSVDTNNFDAGDYYYADYNNGTTWNRVMYYDDNAAADQDAYILNTTNLSEDVSNNTLFKIRFGCNTNLGTEGCNLDNITIMGDLNNISAENDNEFPQFTNHTTSPGNGTQYSQGKIYEFNMTITSTNGTAGIQFNNNNYSITNLTSNNYNFSITNLSAGTYTYHYFAWGNGTDNNYNASEDYSITIKKKTNNLTLLLNDQEENLTINYGTQTNITATTEYGIITLYNNGQDITSQNGQNQQLSAGNYNITATTTGGQNHTATSKTLWLNITRATPNLVFKLNNTEENITLQYFGLINASATSTTNTVQIFRNSQEITSENHQEILLGTNAYTYTAVALENQNYTGLNITRTLEITRAQSQIKLELNHTVGNITLEEGTIILLNGTKMLGDSSAEIKLYQNNKVINQNSQEASNNTNFTNPGIQNITLIYEQTQNYTRTTKTYLVNVTNTSTPLVPDTTLPIITLLSPANNTNITTNKTWLVANYSDNTQLVNATLQVMNSTGSLIITNTTAITGTTNTTNLTITLPYQGTFYWNYEASDNSSNNNTSESRTLNYQILLPDTTPPQIRIISPENNRTYQQNQTRLNYTVSDTNLQACWYSTNQGVKNTSINCGTNITSAQSSEGQNTWQIWANDTSGNINKSEITFSVDSSTVQAPTLTLTRPSYASTYNNTQGIRLEFEITNTSSLSTCWHSIDEGVTNTTIPNCSNNTTFNTLTSGNYNITLWANESTLGKKSSARTTFLVKEGNPTVHLLSPENQEYTNQTMKNLSYEIGNIPLESCELFGNFNGTYEKIMTNQTPLLAGQQNIFETTMIEGSHDWAVQCTDTTGNKAITGNRTINVDTTAPNITNISTQGNTYDEGEDIPLDFDVNDNSPITQCQYEIRYNDQTLTLKIIQGCDNTTISALTPSTYELIIRSVDAAGNTGSRTTDLVIVSREGSSSSSSSSSSGSGGGSPGITGRANISITNLPAINLKRGESEFVSFQVQNTGSRFLNKCQLRTTGEIEGWVENKQSESLSSGQKAEFVIAINTPLETEVRTHTGEITIACEELNHTQEIEINIMSGDFEIFINNAEKTSNNKLRITYTLENHVEKELDLDINYQLKNSEGLEVAEGTEKQNIPGKTKQNSEIEFNLPKDSVGEFFLTLEAKKGFETSSATQKVLLRQESITGLAISDDNARTLTILGLFILLSFATYIVMKTFKNHKQHKKLRKHKRQFIKLDLKNHKKHKR